MLESRMVIACTLYKQVVDEYGGIRAVNPVSTTCWLRQIDSLQHIAQREQLAANAMAWFRGGEAVSMGDIITAEGNNYRVLAVTAARKLGSDIIEFKKCTLERFDSFVS